ncbi:MAG: metal-dependent hydrolase [Eubacteriales bacterium]
MMHYTHSPGGVLSVALYYTYGVAPPNLAIMALGLALGGIGGLLPDIDHSGSKITKKTGIIGLILSKLLSHRGLSHTPILWIGIFGALMYYFPLYQFICLPLLLGCLSHILLDALTPQGVPLLAPLSRQKINFLTIQTGGNIERLCSMILQAACLYFIFQLGYQGLF